MPDVLCVTGASGFLGQAVALAARDAGWQVIGTYFSHQIDIPGVISLPLDIRDRNATLALARQWQPAIIIHCAAKQGNARLMAGSIVKGSANVAAAAAAVHARLLHLSTDVIFDGKKGWYREEDVAKPVHDYGKAKAAAEIAVTGAHPAPIIVRTSLITDPTVPDRQSGWVLDSLRRCQPITLFTDEYRCPIHRDDLVRTLLELATGGFSGVWHVAGAERVNRYEIALALAQFAGLDATGILRPGLSQEGSSPRPRDCSLDCHKVQAILDFRLRGFHDFLL